MVRVKPGEEIRLVKDNLAFAVALSEAAASGRVAAEPILRPAPDNSRFHRPQGLPSQSEGEVSAELSRGAANQMRAAFALSALQAQRSMALAFHGEPIDEEWPELRTARCAIHLIGLAVERSIVQPVWLCPPSYRRLFHIRRLNFTLNAAGIEGQVLSWDDFGGLKRYLSLLEYCAASADAAVESGADRPSRTLTRGPPVVSVGLQRCDRLSGVTIRRPTGYCRIKAAQGLRGRLRRFTRFGVGG